MDRERSVTRVFTNRTGRVRAVALAPDGKQLATGGSDAVITLWDIASGSETARFRGHGKDVLSLLYSADGETLFSGSADGTIRAWNVRATVAPKPELLPPGALAGKASRNGRFLPIYHSDTKLASVFDLETGTDGLNGPLPPDYSYETLTVSPNGQQAAFGRRDGSVDLWENSKLSTTLRAHSNAIVAVEFSPDGGLLATAAKGAEVRVWEGREHRLTLTRNLAEPESINPIKEMVFAPDASFLVVPARKVHLLSLRQGGKDRRIPTLDYIPCLNISGDGSLVAAAVADEVCVWEVSSLRLLRRLQGGRGEFTSISLSADGQRLLASDALGVARLWDTVTGREVGRFQTSGSFFVVGFQDAGNNVLLQTSAIGRFDSETELLGAPTWSEIAETEKAEAKARQVWMAK